MHWAIDQGVVDPHKICIFGSVYGGYVCLTGLTFTPDLYKYDVDIVGPSNIKMLFDSIPSYWGPLRNDILKKIGDTDTDKVFNKMIFPLNHIDTSSLPLLISQGAHDPRVKKAEADQTAFAMQKKDILVEYVLYPDKDHGFARPDNWIDFTGRAELFLAKHLGSRTEAFETPPGSAVWFQLLEEPTGPKEPQEESHPVWKFTAANSK